MLNGRVRSFLTGELFIIASATLWGIISCFSRPLNALGFTSAEITFVRSILSVVFLGVFLLIKDRRLFKISPHDIPLMFFLGVVCFMLVCFFYTRSIEENGSSTAAMLEYTSPIWAMILSRIIFKEKATFLKVVALAGVLCGCALLSFGGEMKISGIGLVFGLGTGIFLALYGVVSKLATEKYSVETIVFYMFLFSTLGSFFIAPAWTIPDKIAAGPTSIYYFLGFAALSTTLAYVFYAAGLRTVSAVKASMFSTVEIITAAAVGLIVFNDRIGVLGYVGIVVTVVSLVFLQLIDVAHHEKKPKVEPQ